MLCFFGVRGVISWGADIPGAPSDISDAALGPVRVVKGHFVSYIARYKIRVKAISIVLQSKIGCGSTLGLP